MPEPFTLPQLRQEYVKKQEYGLLFSCMQVLAIVSSSEDLPELENIKPEDIPKLKEKYNRINLEKLNTNPDIRSRYMSLFEHLKDE